MSQAGSDDGSAPPSEGAPQPPPASLEPASPEPSSLGPVWHWRELRHLRSLHVALGVSALAAILLALNPLLGIPGPESALVLGVLLPPFGAAVGARLTIVLRGRARTGGELVRRVLLVASAPVLLATLVLTLNGLRFPLCSPFEGLAFLLVGPLPGVLLAALVGSLCALLLGARTRVATTIAVLVPIAGALAAASTLYTTPAVYVYAHFVGWFPGTLYDQDIGLSLTYLTFRVLTLARIAVVALTLAALYAPDRGALSLGRARARLGSLVLASLALGIALLGQAWGQELGHRTSSAHIAEVLGARYEGERCIAIVPRETPREQAERLRDDCDFRIAQAEATLGVRQEVPITAFFFRSADEKRMLMGAASTYVAKPWRDEVYLQVAGWPHPVLFHELVHVVAGNTGSGPFRIAGRMGGLLPSPGIIEGMAVAVAWEERDGMTPHQWAQAMIELDHAPSIAETEGLGFLLQPASRAYTASGSFVRWVLDTRGAEVVREIYRRGDYEGPLGMPLARAEEEWRAYLAREAEVPREGLALAEARFERPAIFAQVCPHLVAQLTEAVAVRLASGDEGGAIAGCREILAIDAGDTRARARLGIALAQVGRESDARAELTTLIGPPSAARPVITYAQLGIADALWSRGDRDGARELYRELSGHPMSEDEARQIEVRLLALDAGGAAERALRELLAPAPSRAHDMVTTMAAIARLREVRSDGLADYLEARQLVFRERFDLALPLLTRAEELGLPSERVRRESRRMRAESLVALGRLDEAEPLFRAHAAEGGIAARAYARDWQARIAWSR